MTRKQTMTPRKDAAGPARERPAFFPRNGWLHRVCAEPRFLHPAGTGDRT